MLVCRTEFSRAVAQRPCSRRNAGWSSGRGKLCTRAALGSKDAKRKPRRENVDGAFFVDHTCIDCDTCRWMAPTVFERVGNMSAVTHQPENPEDREKAMQALLSCPTFSIHVDKTKKGEVAEVQDGFPIPVAGAPNVFHCGFHDEKSFGGTSYFVTRPEGNILVDCPRFNPLLAKKFQALGGIKWIFLTHRDDVGDHEKWASKFGAKRLIHETEVNVSQGTVNCEIQVEGQGPWYLEDGSEDIEFIHTPGHTSGSITMFYSPSKVMFTGDHMGYSRRMGRLAIYRGYSFGTAKEQAESAQKLLDYDFLHILPGHGRRYRFQDAVDRLEMMAKTIELDGGIKVSTAV